MGLSVQVCPVGLLVWPKVDDVIELTCLRSVESGLQATHSKFLVATSLSEDSP